MHVFAIGASGVLGRHLVPMLLRRGHDVTVMAPDRLDRLPGEARRVRASLLDPAAERLLAAEFKEVDAVVNAATAVPAMPTAPGGWARNTALRSTGTAVVTGALQEAEVRRFVQMSITMVYADGGDDKLTEAAPLDHRPERATLVDPVLAMETAVRKLPADEIAWSILRGGRFVGPGTVQDQQRARLRAEDLPIPGAGREWVSMVHARDYADAVVAALERGCAGKTLNVADQPVRVADYYRDLARADDSPPPRHDPNAAAEPSHRVSSEAARQLLGWAPVHGIWPLGDDEDR
ncbi:NAD(P)-dependent oxidoreductase [Saccharopolyspora sp. ASAGF58]|uniref:NAD-dependent epimerase/dehydratase family protein n=1 Tax=Saccharopolyspora sp. ASAGF58 TaxID=2719023 RepID=UPI0014457780|nr:NAD(P)-dependent oxidoreductase [Saccharopolyspora sp. ASAGF58]